jgi:hypothetical protein
VTPQIDWVVGDTTDSINYLSTGDADIAITYNAAAEYRALNLSIATKRVYGFRDHFYLVGPGYAMSRVCLPRVSSDAVRVEQIQQNLMVIRTQFMTCSTRL